jgi:dihydrolipoamide dehydrogenase
MRKVDVAIIGAGHAGLNALKEVRRAGCSWVLIDGGPLGTTCARVGCMPSKAVIELAQHLRPGRVAEDNPSVEAPALLERVRDLRDIFVDLVLANSTDNMIEGKDLLRGHARFIQPYLLEVNGEYIRARRTIVATGSRPAVPAAWRKLGERVLTSDSLFDLEHLPESVAVVGLGAIGIELGQALHRLGVQVTGFNAKSNIAGIADPEVNTVAVQTIAREFPLHLGAPVEIAPESVGVRVKIESQEASAERVLVAVGRVPNIPEGLSQLCETDRRGVPRFDPRTLQVGDLPIFIAGDSTGDRMKLQDAAEEGRVAGINATQEIPTSFPQRVPMAIVFSDPNVAQVGARLDEVPEAVVGHQRFGPIGRALIMGRNRGLIRLYAEHGTGRLLGAAMVGPRVEHLAHLVAWSVQQGHTVHEMQQMPFYHPVIEEALQDALKDTTRRVEESAFATRAEDLLKPAA